MRGDSIASSVQTVFAAILLVLVAGCSRSDRSYDRYLPPAEDARQALETALKAWQSGRPPGRIDIASSAVQVVDSPWRDGQKLAAFDILAEDPGEGGRWFKVRLTLSQPPGEQVVRYAVVGRNPIWVYREEDYQRAIGMGTPAPEGQSSPVR